MLVLSFSTVSVLNFQNLTSGAVLRPKGLKDRQTFMASKAGAA
jgi:hypothetical protein